MDRKTTTSLVLLILSMCLISSSSTLSQASPANVIQIALVLDGSTSISAEDWILIRSGVASAILNNLPHDGTVEITVIQFASNIWGNASVVIPPTVISSDAVAESVANQVNSTAQGGGYTPMAHGLYLAWQMIKSSPNFDPEGRQIINLATDGVPNVRNYNATTDLDGDEDIDAYDDVIAVVNTAVSEGLDELDIEGIAISEDARNWFRDHVLYPQPGHIAPPYIPGWIRVVANAEEFAQTVGEKFEVIVERYTPVGGVIIMEKDASIDLVSFATLTSAIIFIAVISAIYLKTKR